MFLVIRVECTKKHPHWTLPHARCQRKFVFQTCGIALGGLLTNCPRLAMAIEYQRDRDRNGGRATTNATLALVAVLCAVFVFYPETYAALDKAMSYLQIR